MNDSTRPPAPDPSESLGPPEQPGPDHDPRTSAGTVPGPEPADAHRGPRLEAHGDAEPEPKRTREDTRRYQELIRSVRAEWAQQEARGDVAVQMSPRALDLVKASVRAQARHGRQVEMPATEEGPYSLSELALRTLVRESVDAVPGVRALRSRIEHAEPTGQSRDLGLGRGLPVRITCRISAAQGTRDLLALAQEVRTSVAATCRRELDLPALTVDIHIEDLHDDDTA